MTSRPTGGRRTSRSLLLVQRLGRWRRLCRRSPRIFPAGGEAFPVSTELRQNLAPIVLLYPRSQEFWAVKRLVFRGDWRICAWPRRQPRAPLEREVIDLRSVDHLGVKCNALPDGGYSRVASNANFILGVTLTQETMSAVVFASGCRPSSRILGAENVTSASENARNRGFATDHLVEVDADVVFLHVARRLR